MSQARLFTPLRVGGLGALGLGLPEFLGARACPGSEATPVAGSSTFGRAKHCILLYMWGGPPHMDTFDMKPGHANGGQFKEVATKVP